MGCYKIKKKTSAAFTKDEYNPKPNQSVARIRPADSIRLIFFFFWLSKRCYDRLAD